MSRIGAVIDARSSLIRAFLALAPFLIGFYPLTGLINPFWGSLFGFPLHLAAAGHSVAGPHSLSELAAFLLWPVVLIALLAWLAGRLIQSHSRWRTLAVLAWSASIFFVVPFEVAMSHFSDWPLYGAFE